MVKTAAGGAAVATGPGIYSATYSGIPVYEYQFGTDLKEHVMRRRQDDWINATHILKAAGFDKPARTRILEREVQKDVHEKIQGGYGKYQGTWIPLESGQALANRNNVYDRLRPIFEFTPGSESPPPAPRHTSKPKQPKKPAVPKFNNKAPRPSNVSSSQSIAYNVAGSQDGFDNGDVVMGEDDTPDNLTVASASFMAEEEDRQDASQFSTGHRKRKREDMTEQQHSMYGDELLDYFLLSRNERPAIRPDPPTNFQPDWPIDTDSHTALHWASAMGDVEVIKQLKRFGARLNSQNVRGETPLMRAVNFTNCYEKQTFPAVLKELYETIDQRDHSGCTVIHHAAIMKSGRVASPSCSRYYLDNILNKLPESHDPSFIQQFIDAQDSDGNTAVHLAAQNGASKCIRALLGRGASTDIANNAGVRAEDLIMELNASKKARAAPQRSSSPFAPEHGGGHHRPHSSAAAARGDAPPDHSAGGGPSSSQHSSSSSGKLLATVAAMALSCKSQAASAVQSHITPLVVDKFQNLVRSYDDEWREKDDAEREATRLLANAQAELASVQRAVEEAEALLQQQGGADSSAEAAMRLEQEVEALQSQVLALVSEQNRIAVEGMVDRELSEAMNGDGSGSKSGGAESGGGPGSASASAGNGGATPGGAGGGGGGGGDASKDNNGGGGAESSGGGGISSVDERLKLAEELRKLLVDQQAAEKEYVAALGVVGTGEKIEKYRHLLKRCLGTDGAEGLDDNLDGMIMVMEEEAADLANNNAHGGHDDAREDRDRDGDREREREREMGRERERERESGRLVGPPGGGGGEPMEIVTTAS